MIYDVILIYVIYDVISYSLMPSIMSFVQSFVMPKGGSISCAFFSHIGFTFVHSASRCANVSGCCSQKLHFGEFFLPILWSFSLVYRILWFTLNWKEFWPFYDKSYEDPLIRAISVKKTKTNKKWTHLGSSRLDFYFG